MMLQPAAASARVAASPMPLLAPVITATEGIFVRSVMCDFQLDGQVAAGGLPLRNREDHTISLPQASSTEVMRPERKALADGMYETSAMGRSSGHHVIKVRCGSNQ